MIVLAQAVWRDVTASNAIAVTQAQFHAGEPVFHMVNSGDALIARSRSILATRFLREDEFKDADVLVFVDGDITFGPHDFNQIVAGARDTGDIYGGIYVTRAREPHAASRTLGEQSWEFHKTDERRPLEVQYLATGFMAIPRSLLESMILGEFEDIDGTHELHEFKRGANAESVIDFFRTFGVIEPDGVAHWLSEDWAFCERARQMGRKVWADQSVILGHQGQVTLTVEDIGAPGSAIGSNAPPAGGTVAALSDPTPLHPLIASLPADIAAWAGSDEQHVRDQLPHGAALAAALWDDPADVGAWYEREDVGRAYVYDLAHWHMQGAAQHFYDVIRSGQGTHIPTLPMRILDYGAGIGTLALMLAADGHDVQVYEPNGVMRRFLDFRRSQLHPDANRPVIVEPEYTKPNDRDLVIATHVFEHLMLVDTIKALGAIAAALAPGGLLFYENDFHADPLHPQHVGHAELFAGALADAGFTDLGDGWARKAEQQTARGRSIEGVASAGLV